MPGGGMSSDDVLLKYIDDDTDSYSNIFDNAKTDISNKDKTRLIEALQKLSSGEELNDTVDVDSVIRYFVVHNFVLNFDSYTGSMIHNYYLYEKDGQMQMLPWDYNLAFGGFESAGGATNLVNYPIDSPVSGGNVEDRPMIAWIFAIEEYTELYHSFFSEFISEWFENGNFENIIDSVSSMISPYVEKDPTKFCTFEQFEKGVSTLKEFCLLRAESIEGQLNGSIGSTSDTQKSNELIDAGDLQISDMGTMQNSMGNGMNKPNSGMQNQQITTDNYGFQQAPPLSENNSQSSSSEQTPSNNSDSTENNAVNETFPQVPGEQIQGRNAPNQHYGYTLGDFTTDMIGKTPNANSTPNEIGQKNSPEQSANSTI
ncbi:MAG: CotH kinase family protein, partial [Oscillospiraceae bacterium]|nr:CotH kinase family protein [Oscillospiraceae bacterium]